MSFNKTDAPVDLKHLFLPPGSGIEPVDMWTHRQTDLRRGLIKSVFSGNISIKLCLDPQTLLEADIATGNNNLSVRLFQNNPDVVPDRHLTQANWMAYEGWRFEPRPLGHMFPKQVNIPIAEALFRMDNIFPQLSLICLHQGEKPRFGGEGLRALLLIATNPRFDNDTNSNHVLAQPDPLLANDPRLQEKRTADTPVPEYYLWMHKSSLNEV